MKSLRIGCLVVSSWKLEKTNQSILLKSLNPRVNDKQAPLPSYLTVADYHSLITLKSPICCKYNYPRIIHDFTRSKITVNEENNDSSGNNNVKKLSLSNCCNCNSSDSIDALVDEEGRLTNWGVARASHPIPSTCNLYYYEVKIFPCVLRSRGQKSFHVVRVIWGRPWGRQCW